MDIEEVDVVIEERRRGRIANEKRSKKHDLPAPVAATLTDLSPRIHPIHNQQEHL